ncbi:MAG: hypothetical protein LIO79_04510 [Rikenellaceae bacterium]|nr:hypothetical protein [Rikenellaceae bacterium]
MRKIISVAFTAICALALFSCGTSTKVVSSWKSPLITGNPMEKTLVLAMLADREAEDQIERILSDDLARHGVTVITGTAEFGPKGFGDISQDQLTAKLEKDGFTSIMIICLVDKEKDLNYVPGSPYISPYGPVYYGYYGRYRYMYDNIYSPGYFTTSTTYVLDANLYSLPEDKLIYSAQTRSYDLADNKSLAESFSQEIVNALIKNNILKY